MNPATIALLLGSIVEASKFIAELAELFRKGETGELDEETVLAHFRQMQAERRETRHDWDNPTE
jgi:hypothetical protein